MLPNIIFKNETYIGLHNLYVEELAFKVLLLVDNIIKF